MAETIIPVILASTAGAIILLASSITASFAGKLTGLGPAPKALVMEGSNALLSILAALTVLQDPGLLGAPSLPLPQSLQALALATLLLAAIHATGRLLCRNRPKTHEAHRAPGPTETILLLIAGPTGEELLFRGLVEGILLATKTPHTLAILVPAALFSLAHLPAPLLDSQGKPTTAHRAFTPLAALALGILTGYYRATTGSILLPIILHSIVNTNSLLATIKTRPPRKQQEKPQKPPAKRFTNQYYQAQAKKLLPPGLTRAPPTPFCP